MFLMVVSIPSFRGYLCDGRIRPGAVDDYNAKGRRAPRNAMRLDNLVIGGLDDYREKHTRLAAVAIMPWPRPESYMSKSPASSSSIWSS